jgi:Uma2 family endonuclease
VAVSIRKRLLSNEEYHQMVGAGILSEDERVELIQGEILEMSPIGNPHAACLRRLLRLLSPSLGLDVMIDVQNPIHLPEERSEPQPDLVLLRAREDGYAAEPPTAGDILLVVEIADSSLAYDRDVKVPLYGRSGIPETWLLDLPGDSIVIYRRPGPQLYQSIVRLRRGETLSPEALPHLRLTVEALLG